MYYGSWDGLKWSAVNVLFGQFEVISYKCIMEVGNVWSNQL